MLVRTFAALLGVVSVSRCERTSAPPKNVPATRALPSIPLQLELPDDATVQASGGGVAIVIHPGHRNPLRIDIKRAAEAGAFFEQGAKKRSLAPQLQLSYRESVQPGGSGGDEAILDGELMFGGDRYHVTCSRQSELAPAATECLPVLATLRAVTR